MGESLILEKYLTKIPFRSPTYKASQNPPLSLFLQHRRTNYSYEEDIISLSNDLFPNKKLEDVFHGILFYQTNEISAKEIGLVFKINQNYLIVSKLNFIPIFDQKKLNI